MDTGSEAEVTVVDAAEIEPIRARRIWPDRDWRNQITKRLHFLAESPSPQSRYRQTQRSNICRGVSKRGALDSRRERPVS